MTFAELSIQVDKMRPALSAEGQMLVDLFMPFCEAQEATIKKLKDQLATNSSNSSKPPSKDDFKPPKKRSLRKISGKKPGGQPGHKGVGGKLKDDIDHIINHRVNHCPDCGHDLKSAPIDEIVRRQVEDLPPIKTIVTEHRIERKTCPCCNIQWQAGGCPVNHEFQYGPRIKAISIYLSAYQFIPALRTKQLLSVLGVNLSTGSLDNFRRYAARELGPFINKLGQKIAQSTAAFFDETGIKVKGVGHWVHVAATSLLSLFCLHPKRGRDAHEAMNVLPHFTGILHRDDYHSYHNYDKATHSLCNAHLVRDLNFVIEHDGQEEWAVPLKKLLFKIKEQVERSDSGMLCAVWQGRHRKAYRRLIERGLELNPPNLKTNGKQRGRTAQSKTVNLLLRFRDQEDAILRFMTHSAAKFDNNQAERDLRMNKVRQKVSAGFRSRKAGGEFMTIRSLIATAVKQGLDPVEQLVAVFTPGDETYMQLVNNPE